MFIIFRSIVLYSIKKVIKLDLGGLYEGQVGSGHSHSGLSMIRYCVEVIRIPMKHDTFRHDAEVHYPSLIGEIQSRREMI